MEIKINDKIKRIFKRKQLVNEDVINNRIHTFNNHMAKKLTNCNIKS